MKPREEIRAAEEIANRTVCNDFEKFRPVLDQVKQDLDAGVRQTRQFQKDAEIKLGEFFIVGGQIAYVAKVGDEFLAEYGRPDRRLRVVYDNGPRANCCFDRFSGRSIRTMPAAVSPIPMPGSFRRRRGRGRPRESGTIYVLRSKSEHSDVAAHRELIHKIGVTGGKIETRIAGAALDATYLLADVEIVASYTLFNINRTRLEKILHRVLSAAQLDLTIKDRFGNPVKPREWFLVAIAVIDQVVDRIRDGTIVTFAYDPFTASFNRARSESTNPAENAG